MIKPIKTTYFYKYIFVFNIVLFNLNLLASPDSIQINKTYSNFRASVYTNLSKNINWESTDYSSFSFVGNIEYRKKMLSNKFNQFYNFKGNLGYYKYIDSIWYKNLDNFNISVQLIEKSGKRITHGYSMNLKSQFTNSWKYVKIKDEMKKKWKSGPFNPCSILLSYVLTKELWKSSYISFSFATLKINIRPIDQEMKDNLGFIKLKSSTIISEYGISLKSNISEKITDNVIWENFITAFYNGLNKDRVNLDFENRFLFKFVKILNFAVITRVIYDPIDSYKLQLKHDF